MDFDQAAAYADECDKRRAEEKRKKEEEEARKNEFRVLSDDSVLLHGDAIQTTQGPVPFIRVSGRRQDAHSVTITCSFCEGSYVVDVVVTRDKPALFLCTEVDRDHKQYQTTSLERVARTAIAIYQDQAVARFAHHAVR